MKKVIIIVLLVLAISMGLLYGAFYYVNNYGGNHVLDRKELIGDTSNNPYEIRNDVYDKLIEVLDNEAKKDPDFKQEGLRNLIINAIKLNMAEFTYFAHEQKSSYLIAHGSIIVGCLGNRGKIDFFDKIHSGLGYKSEVYELLFNTNDRKLANKFVHSNRSPDWFNYNRYKDYCEKYEERVWKSSEFTELEKR